MNKNDMRVIRTRRNIKRAFSELIRKKPLEKITVTEIASLAEINKGTFYLHYADIYELYREFLREHIEETADSIPFYADFFDAPEQFVRQFIVIVQGSTPLGKMSDVVLDRKNRNVPQLISDAFRKRLYALDRIEPNPENDVKLDAILFSMTVLIMKYGDENTEEIIKVMTQNIRDNFPPGSTAGKIGRRA